jgi:hypothetical protein
VYVAAEFIGTGPAPHWPGNNLDQLTDSDLFGCEPL